MPIVGTLTDYTDKDFKALRLRLRNLVRSVFPEWTDFNVADFGNILLELFAHTGDVLTFYQDNQARQSRIVTATQRKAILGLVKLIGYAPSSATAATVDVNITLAGGAVAGDANFARGTIIKTEDVSNPTRYQLLEDAIIPAGQTTVTGVSAENSETKTQSFVSTNLPNQEVVLGSTPYIDLSAVVVAGNGAYAQVDNFLNSTPTDRHFTVVVDQNDRATIRFGNGASGAIPTGTGDIEFKVGGGAAGRVDINKLKVFEQTVWTDSLGAPISPVVTNPAKSSGGTDRQSVAQIKERGPASVTALTRSVGRDDFETNVLRLPAVARALFLTRDEDESVQENTGILYVVPVGGGLPSTELKADCLRQITVEYPCTLTFKPSVRDPVYRVINVSMIIYFRTKARADAATAIRESLAAFFNVQNSDGSKNTNIDFGGNIKDADGVIVSELAHTDILNVARDTIGVRKLNAVDFLLNGVADDVPLAKNEFPTLGTVTIVDGDTGDVL